MTYNQEKYQLMEQTQKMTERMELASNDVKITTIYI